MRAFMFLLMFCQTAAAQSIVVSSGGNSIVMSSYADALPIAESVAPKPIKIELPLLKPAVPLKVKPVVVHKVGSSEWQAEKHLRETHNITVSGLSLAEMEVLHDEAHGGSAYHFPSMASLNTASLGAVQPVRYASVRSSSSCPGGVCPTRKTSRARLRRR